MQLKEERALPQQLSIVDRLVAGHGPAEDAASVVNAICRDLLLLLNSWAVLRLADGDRFVSLKTCVLNYGVPSVAGKPIREQVLNMYQEAIQTAIERFEPRLDPETVLVHAVAEHGPSATTRFSLRIEGQLVGADSGRRLVFDSSVNTETGRVSLS